MSVYTIAAMAIMKTAFPTASLLFLGMLSLPGHLSAQAPQAHSSGSLSGVIVDDGGVGTPGVLVELSGGDANKRITFQPTPASIASMRGLRVSTMFSR